MDADEDGVGDGLFIGALPDILLAEGPEYIVTYNGVAYLCKLLKVGENESTTTYAMGNLGAITGGENTGEPFLMQFGYNKIDDVWDNAIASFDGSTSVTLSIAEVKYTPIPVQYMTNAFPYYIEVTGSGTEDDPYVCNDTVENVKAQFNAGRTVCVRYRLYLDGVLFLETIYTFCTRAKDNEIGYTLIFMTLQSVVNQPMIMLKLLPQSDGSYTVECKNMK
jgi:hypothetical protein